MAFVVAVEILACKIRQAKHTCIKGLNLLLTTHTKNVLKLAQYADDMTIFAKDKNNILNIIQLVTDFSVFSRLKLNREKSEAMWIGSSKNSSETCGEINWKTDPNDHLKILGI